MNDPFLKFMIYATTPIMLVLGLGVMYLLIRDHPLFLYIVGGYVALLMVLFMVKFSLFKTLLARRDAAPDRVKERNG
ncbi:MAG: hypothetical protein WC824_14405 [Bacteroidota bacterium]|jgi:hypothetical protein